MSTRACATCGGTGQERNASTDRKETCRSCEGSGQLPTDSTADTDRGKVSPIHECYEMAAMAPRKTTIANLGEAQYPHFPDKWHLSFPTHDDDPGMNLDIVYCPYCGTKLPLHGRDAAESAKKGA